MQVKSRNYADNVLRSRQEVKVDTNELAQEGLILRFSPTSDSDIQF